MPHQCCQPFNILIQQEMIGSERMPQYMRACIYINILTGFSEKLLNPVRRYIATSIRYKQALRNMSFIFARHTLNYLIPINIHILPKFQKQFIWYQNDTCL